ncbi:MAG: hypothetical protein HUU55_04365 [Myxococcales bacterium]|nr:hypothetical protein [Myxococcales bacterium]
MITVRDPERDLSNITDNPADSELDIIRIAKGIFKRRWLIVLQTIVVTALFATPFLLLRKPAYEAESWLLVRDSRNIFAGTPLASSVLANASIDTTVELLQMPAVLDEAARQLGFPDGETLKDAVIIGAEERARMVFVRTDDADPKHALRITETILRVLMEQHAEQLNRQFDESLLVQNGEVERAQTRLNTAQEAMVEFARYHGFEDDQDLMQVVAHVAELSKLKDGLALQIKAAEAQLKTLEEQLGAEDPVLTLKRQSATGTTTVSGSAKLFRTPLMELSPEASEALLAWVPQSQQQAQRQKSGNISKAPNPVHQTLFLARLQQEQLIVSLKVELEDATERLAAVGQKHGRLSDLRRKLERLTVERDFAAEQLSTALAALATTESVRNIPNPVYETVLSPPPPKKAKRSKTSLILIGMAMFAGLLSVATAFLLELRDTTIHDAREVERFGVPVIANIPNRANADRADYEEAIKQLALLLRRLPDGRETRCLVFTSPNPGDGKTQTVRATADVLAEWGEAVLRIDANLRERSTHVPYLERYLSGDTAKMELVRMPSGVLAMTSAGAGEQTANLLAAGRLRQLFDIARTDFRHVLVDAPALLPSVDAQMLTEQADYAVLVIRSYFTRSTDVVAARKQLQNIGKPILGAILLDVPQKGKREVTTT